jgi:hypothetical protein
MRTSCVLGHLGFYLLDAKSNCEELFRAGSDSACSSHWPAVRKFLNRWPHRPWQLAAGVSLGVMVIEPHLAMAMAVYAFAPRWIAVIAATA